MVYANRQLRSWVRAMRLALTNASEVAAVASEAYEGHPEMLVFEKARRAIRDLAETNEDVAAALRLGLPNTN